jgi:hypothetical protein
MRLRADFNGIFATGDGGLILCLSHGDTSMDELGQSIPLHEGMKVTAYDEDSDENGNRDDLIASGVVVESPEWLRCKGSKWSLSVDENGYCHESDLKMNRGK